MKFINASILASLAFSVPTAFAGPVDHKAVAAAQNNGGAAAAAPANAGPGPAAKEGDQAADAQAQADAEAKSQEAHDALVQQLEDGQVAADVNGTEILEGAGAALDDANLEQGLQDNILNEMFLLGVCNVNAQQLADFNLNVAESINLLLQLQALQQLQVLGLVQVQDVAALLEQQLILGFGAVADEESPIKRGINRIMKVSFHPCFSFVLPYPPTPLSTRAAG